jgi:hypothetical protein
LVVGRVNVAEGSAFQQVSKVEINANAGVVALADGRVKNEGMVNVLQQAGAH